VLTIQYSLDIKQALAQPLQTLWAVVLFTLGREQADVCMQITLALQ
jgi:hypothetical protein